MATLREVIDANIPAISAKQALSFGIIFGIGLICGYYLTINHVLM